MNQVITKEDFNIILFRSYDCLIGIDWMDTHRVVLDCYNEAFPYLDEEWNSRIVKGIPRPISVRDISTSKLKRSFREGC
jgi:hypothetical protein